MDAILMFGPPGSGKGTQSALLAEHLNIPHISMGDVLRSISSEKKEEYIKTSNDDLDFVQKVKDLIDNGKLLDGKNAWKILKIELLRISKNHSFVILDGYPRTVEQFEYMTNDGVVNIKKMFFLNSDPRALIERLSNRLVCSLCKSIYNKNLVQNGFCPTCKTNSLIKRKDDLNDERINKRILEYNNNTMPIIEFCRKNYSNLEEIDASNSKYDVWEEIKSKL